MQCESYSSYSTCCGTKKMGNVRCTLEAGHKGRHRHKNLQSWEVYANSVAIWFEPDHPGFERDSCLGSLAVTNGAA